MSEESQTWEPAATAGYIAASITKSARECPWPDEARGNAACFLIQDLGEFGQAMVACGRAGFWSPAKALERMFLERVEVLMATNVDSSVAKRYLDSVMAPPKSIDPLKPGRKARPEDALSRYLEKTALSEDAVRSFRESWVNVKNIASDWFVHPTAMGPLLSRSVQNLESDGSSEWSGLVQILISGCVYIVAAGSVLQVPLVPELVRSIYAGAQLLAQTGYGTAEAMMDIHREIERRAAFVPRPTDGEK